MSNRSDKTFTLPDTLPTDPILADLLPEFASQWHHDLTVTWSALATAKDAEGLRRLGHTIKGSFLQFGFREMSTAGKHIMACADQNNWEEAEEYINALRAAMEDLARRVGRPS